MIAISNLNSIGMYVCMQVNCLIWSFLSECSPSQPCQGLGPHAHFRDFGTAMLTLFRIATGDNWNGILEVSEYKKNMEILWDRHLDNLLK